MASQQARRALGSNGGPYSHYAKAPDFTRVVEQPGS
jgi:hypothetical protein